MFRTLRKNHKVLFLILIGVFSISFVFLAFHDLQFSQGPVFKSQLHAMFDIRQTCGKKTSIAFLKIHKAGSSTVSNILQRFSTRYGLNLILPNKDRARSRTMFHVIGRDYERIIPIPDDENYHILCNHVVYSRRQFKRWFRQGAFYMAILRDPKERFLSSAYYFGLVKRLSKYENTSSNGSVFTNYLRQRIRNASTADDLNMAHDFGMRHRHYRDAQYIQKYIKLLGIDFDLVMIMEYFDESLVLMKRKLCWELKDIVYLKLNANEHKDEHALNEEDRKILRDIQMPDEMLYTYFSGRLWKEVYEQGPDFFEEVQFFKTVQKRVSKFCTRGYDLKTEFLKIEGSRWNEKFHLLMRDCTWMQTDELKLNDILMKRQWQKYNAYVENRKEALINVI